MKNEELVKQFSQVLPQRINVHSGGSPEEGYWAKITADGTDMQNCYTQADSISELILMVNDAVKTHYEVPEDIRDQVGFYAPLSENHLRWEEMLTKLVSMEKEDGDLTTSLELQSN